MPLAAQLRSDIERALAHRIPSALTPQVRMMRPLAPTGIAALDGLLGGGLPVGAITEIVGSLASGRVSCTQAFLAQTIQAGQVCAWIDAADSFDPESAAANGVDLERLLWVRCGPAKPAALPVAAQTAGQAVRKEASASVAAAGFTPLAATAIAGGGGSPHPRNEGHGLPAAVESLLGQDAATRTLRPGRRDRSIGTPGAGNRPLQAREEQVAFDRLPARRGSYVLEQRAEKAAGQKAADQHAAEMRTDARRAEAVREQIRIGPRCAEPQGRRLRTPAQSMTPPMQGTVSILQKPESSAHSGALADRRPPSVLNLADAARPLGSRTFTREAKPWDRLDQALRTTDLLLQAGGFGAIVLDLGSIAPQFANRIPLASWFRFRAAADRARTTVLLLTQHPCAQTSAELVLRTSVLLPTQATVLGELHYSVELVRQRFQPEPGPGSRPEPGPEPHNLISMTSMCKPPARASSTEWVAHGSWTYPR